MSGARTAVLGALRDVIRDTLQLKRRDVGGWEMVPERDVTVAVFFHQGTYGDKPGRLINGSDTVTLELTLRHGSVPMAEAEVDPLIDALGLILKGFTHPLIAGANATNWSFDLIKDGTFTNILTVNGVITWRTRAPESDVLTAAQAVLRRVQQET